MWSMKEILFSAMLTPDLAANRFQLMVFSLLLHNLDHHISRGDNKAMPVPLHITGIEIE